MDDETRAALEASIRHWEENLAAETPDGVSIGPDNCALCDMFLYDDVSCGKCPVAQRTGFGGCNYSPYENAEDALEDWDEYPNDEEYRATWRKAAQAELDFLKSLRPEGESNETSA